VPLGKRLYFADELISSHAGIIGRKRPIIKPFTEETENSE
jgi:hypothetical protein